MGRRRRKAPRVLRRTLPKVFSCPRCGMITVRITSREDETSHDFVFSVACGNATCGPGGGLRRDFRYNIKKEEIDAYNAFVDDFVRAGG